jgi:O-methyltransferase domain/Dimerisation domain
MEYSTPKPDHLLEIGHAFRSARAVMSAVELGVFTALAESTLDANNLRQRVGIAERGAQDFFDTLVALGLVQRDDLGRYSNAPVADFYLDSRKATYIGGFFENLSAREYGMWSSLTQALCSGTPQTGFEPTAHFGTLYSDPNRRDFFVKAMTSVSLLVAQTMVERFPWRQYKTVVDVGTAQGCLPVQIALSHSHINGGGFDLPILKTTFDTFVQRHELSHRLQFYPGDFFADPLPTTEVLVMGRVLHNWDLPTKQMLLQKAHAALASDGALIVYERFIDNERRTAATGLLSSLNMLIMTAGGFDFTAVDCVRWMQDAGFHDMRVEPLVAGHSMVVARK